jgi:hypothetical protein
MAEAVAIRRYRSVSHNLGSCPKLDQINKKTTLYILKIEVNLWKYSRAEKYYRVDKAVTS